MSGRKRPADESNGKSGNLNNALSQIYPDSCKIPGNEVVCIMDADQVCAACSNCPCCVSASYKSLVPGLHSSASLTCPAHGKQIVSRPLPVCSRVGGFILL